MKILLFIGGLSGGGAERVMCNLANYLVNKNNDVTILTMAHDKPTYVLSSEIKRVSLYSSKRGKINNAIERIRKYKKFIKSSNHEIMIAMLPVTILLSLIYRHSFKGKLIISERANPSSYSLIKRVLLKIFAHKADGYIFQTNNAYLWYKRCIKKGKYVIIPNAINYELSLNYNSYNLNSNYIISAGRLSKQKNFQLLIKSFSHISDKYPDILLYIYGNGNEKSRLLNLIKKKKMEKRIFIFDYSENYLSFLKNAILFAFSSNFEGMPNVLIEALALGIPCISTDCKGGGASFLIKNEYNGYLVRRNSKNEFSNALDTLLSKPQKRLSFSKNAYNINDQLSPNVIYSHWLTFIKEVKND